VSVSAFFFSFGPQAQDELTRREAELKKKEELLLQRETAVAAAAQQPITPQPVPQQFTPYSLNSLPDPSAYYSPSKQRYKEEDLERIRSEMMTQFRATIMKHESLMIGLVGTKQCFVAEALRIPDLLWGVGFLKNINKRRSWMF